VTTIVPSLELVSADLRDALNAGPTSHDAFRAALARMTSLDQIEQRSPSFPEPAPVDSARILFWNAERLKFPGPSAEMIRGANPDAVILCELDLGMARTGNRHVTAELAEALKAGYVYAVEFVELDLGDARERGWFAGHRNVAGLHGAGLVSARPLLDPRLLRLETTGRWFDGGFGERRVGGRIAVMASLEVAGQPVLLVSVHYESHTGPADRMEQTRVLLDAIDRDFPGRPVLIGGDFNTNSMERADHERPDAVQRALAADPDRLVRPMCYEPMFDEMAQHGYDWESCNVMGAVTQRTRPDGTPAEPHGRIDWFFARGLACRDPVVIAAVDDSGTAISDHEALAVTIRPATDL
jgi:endonuclease/exonuclease/phosphatase family metal-dependent hydrolase